MSQITIFIHILLKGQFNKAGIQMSHYHTFNYNIGIQVNLTSQMLALLELKKWHKCVPDSVSHIYD